MKFSFCIIRISVSKFDAHNTDHQTQLNMKKVFALFVCSLAFLQHSFSQTPDWATKVAPIIYNNCSNCHHNGGIGPFTLMSYTDAVNHAATIQSQTSSKLMPPWKADP